MPSHQIIFWKGFELVCQPGLVFCVFVGSSVHLVEVDRNIMTCSGSKFKKPQLPRNGTWQSVLVRLYRLGVHSMSAKGLVFISWGGLTLGSNFKVSMSKPERKACVLSTEPGHRVS